MNETLKKEILFLDKFKKNEEYFYRDKYEVPIVRYGTLFAGQPGATATVRLNINDEERQPLNTMAQFAQQLFNEQEQQRHAQAQAMQQTRQYTQEQWNQLNGIYGGQALQNQMAGMAAQQAPIQPRRGYQPLPTAARLEVLADLQENGMITPDAARRIIMDDMPTYEFFDEVHEGEDDND